MDLNNERDRRMLDINQKHAGGNGRDRSGFSETQERKIESGIKVFTWLKWLAVTAALAGATWTTLGARVNQLEKDVAALSETKQSKEAADGTRDVILTKLEEFEKRLAQRLESIEKRIDDRRR